jgi:hypothetical protein
MALQAFYQTVAQLCFTLLGLWLLVLQTKYTEWIGAPARRRMITNIALYFLLPGTMSLLALISPQAHYLWQIAFLVAGGLGAFETAALLRSERKHRSAGWLTQVVRYVGIALYVIICLVALVALFPAAMRATHIVPLMVAGIVVTFIVVAGVTLAWMYFIEPRTDDAG